MNIPSSMQSDLGAWNNGQGIDLESWVGCMGNFALAVGYTTVFWPEFVEIEGYILHKGCSVESLHGFEAQEGIDRMSVQWVMNHLHIADIQHNDCEDLTVDKIEHLGRVLKQIYEAKLSWEFPQQKCTVEFYVPDDPDDLTEYQLSFWQDANEGVPA